MKRVLAVCLSLLFILSFVPFVRSAQADAFDLDSVYEPYFILVNADNPSVSYKGIEKEADRQVFPASTTKILSCIVALENGNLDDMVTVSAKAVDFGRGNSLMGLEEGDVYSMRDLLYGMMLPSGNDAAIAIAEHIAGSTDAFASMMNEKAKSLGMTHSHFVTVHGKQNDGHFTTVRDMAILTAYALKNETFREIVGTPTYTAMSGPRAIELLNSNRLLVDTPATETLTDPASCLYSDAIGVKTGDTTAAGKCLVAAAERDGITLIAILYGGTLNDPSYDPNASDQRRDKYNVYRFQDAIKLFEYAFGDMTHTLTVADLVSYGMPIEFTVQISNASDNDSQGGNLTVNADLAMDTTITVMEPTLNAIKSNMAAIANPTFTNIYAPIGAGSVIGSVTYSYNGKILLSANLLASRSVKEGTAQVDVTQQSPTGSVTLIGDINTPTSVITEPETDGGCGVPQDLRWILIVLPIIFVLLILCVTLFIVYLNAEAKRRKREAARRRAAKRTREADEYRRR